MNDGSITFSTALDNQALEKQLASLTKKVEAAQDKISQKQAERAPLAEQSRQLAAQLDEAKARLEYMRSGEKYFSPSNIKEQETAVRDMQKEWGAVQTKVERYDDTLNKATIELNRNKKRAGAVAQELAKVSRHSERMGAAISRAGDYMQKFTARLKAMVRQALVFYVLYAALRALREWLSKVIKSNTEASAAIAKLKAALLTLAQPLVDLVIPAFIWFINILAAVMTQLARVFSAVFGKTLDQSKKSAEALHKQTDAIKDTGSAAKKAAKELAAFDELNVLSDNSDTGGGGGGGASDSIAPDFGALKEFDTEDYKKKMDEITLYASGALLALGVILTFSGANIPLGLGLMAVGALGLAYSINANWDLIVEKMRGPAGEIVALIGGGLLVLGAILAFSGAAIPLGIALMVTGAAALGAATALNWDKIVASLQGPVGGIMALVGGGLLVLGAVLAFSGAALPLGIGLMIAGAAALGSAVALNWDKLLGKMKGPIGGVVAIVGGALLALGAILAFSGAALPLGIGLMIAGAAALGTVAVLNWDTITKTLKGSAGSVTAVISGALLALGAILTFSGASLPLGIALMAAGAAGLATVTALNWSKIVNELKGPTGKIVAIASGALLALGLILAISGVALPLGIALIAAGAAGLATVTALNWDAITDKLKGPVGKVVAIGSGALLALGLILALSGVALPLGIALIVAGAAGLATVTALNWDAILDKLKEAWNGIKGWWKTYVAPKLTLSFWQDQFNNIKEGLVQKIKDAVNAGIGLFNKFINWINGKLNLSWGSFSLFGQEIIPSGSFRLLTLPQIPYLAAGAVIPPNREFMAVLGDQKNGRNIEAPEGLIRQIVREELGGGGGGDITVTMPVYLDSEKIYEGQKRVERRRGTSLVLGGGTA